jgi:integrase
MKAVRPRRIGPPRRDATNYGHAPKNRHENGLVKGGGETDSIKLLFNRLLVRLKIKRHGVGFGKFRHTHTSAAARHSDTNARKVVRGHKIDGIEEHYDLQDLDRLKSVTDPRVQNTHCPRTQK